jgi:hypothetical protein
MEDFKMANIANGVYWCARDLAGIMPIGNHHFILIATGKDSFNQLGLTPEEEDGVYFYTFGGFKSDDGKLVFGANNEHDVKSVREYVDPEQHTSPLSPDLDLELHRVTPPEGSDFEFMALVSRLAGNYKTNTKQSPPDYKLLDDNCAAWVNTLFAVANVSEEDREKHGEFFGIDWREEDLIDESLFQAQ